MIEKLNERLKELAVQQQQALSRLQQAHNDATAISGAMQEAAYWLEQAKQAKEECKNAIETET